MRLFNFTSRTFILTNKSPNDAGIKPVKRLFAKTMLLTNVKLLSDNGREPETLFALISISINLVRDPTEVGSIPVKLFEVKYKL